jgi:hypothetical protein
MKPKCVYPNTRSAAKSVHRWIQENGIPLMLWARPWNRFEATNTEWWLIPSKEWPAYRHGKYFFSRPWDSHVMFCGLYVEKGLDPSVAVAFPSGQKLVMNRHWTWHEVMSEMRSGEFGEAIAQVAQRSRMPVRLSLNGGFVEDPGSYDPEAPPMDWNYVVFESAGEGIRFISSEIKGEQFAGLIQCESIADLADALEEMPQSDWMWLNFHFGIKLAMAPLDHDPEHIQDAWGPAKLWELCLEPWRRWII